MKALSLLALTVLLVFSSFFQVYAEADTVKMVVEGGEVKELPVTFIDGEAHYSLEALSHVLGWKVEEKDGVIHITSLDATEPISLAIESGNHSLKASSHIGTVDLSFPNGATYKGGVRNGKFHGNGELKLLSGAMYKGDFVDGELHGSGTYTASNGDEFNGTFQHNKIDGNGTYTYANGDRVTGRFSGTMAMGRVDVRYGSGGSDDNILWGKPLLPLEVTAFNLEVLNGNGSVKLSYTNGASYDGEVKAGTFHGNGTLKAPDGGSYNGIWMHDKMEGKGVMKLANGDEYNGYFQNNKFHGDGRYTFANGDIYNGDFENGLKHGEGTYDYVNKNKFEGYWVDGQKHTVNFQSDRSGVPRGYGVLTIDGSRTASGNNLRQYVMYRNGERVGRIQP
ncbi:Uncharacterized conserved protein [Tindallia magadiensis]|uniref:Uncharacterized conserved protein n=1 Tax=Tindallia magadiensis TaxID=69895 RepID=A0A1I3ACN5_9FIRM|nr:hypothetical protein [Tindallia magadiensis]SFH47828.1 Uncharacterized conserved protein [Tindallia magadiensis]